MELAEGAPASGHQESFVAGAASRRAEYDRDNPGTAGDREDLGSRMPLPWPWNGYKLPSGEWEHSRRKGLALLWCFWADLEKRGGEAAGTQSCGEV